MEEKVFFEDGGIMVTNVRFVVSEKIYALAAVSSIRVERLDESKGREFYKFVVFGLVLWALVEWLKIGEGKGDGSYMVIAAIVAGVAGVIWWGVSGKIRNILFVTTSSGEAEALSSYMPGQIQKIEEALSKALIHRG